VQYDNAYLHTGTAALQSAGLSLRQRRLPVRPYLDVLRVLRDEEFDRYRSPHLVRSCSLRAG
jgi:hypothetical protein